MLKSFVGCFLRVLYSPSLEIFAVSARVEEPLRLTVASSTLHSPNLPGISLSKNLVKMV